MTKKRIHFLLNALLAMLAAALFSIPAAMSAFDPVNDDTDIFLANPSIAAERPNVLIILDNTANWKPVAATTTLMARMCVTTCGR